jgi:hypothetical protein
MDKVNAVPVTYRDPHGRDPKLGLKMTSGKIVWPLDFRPDDLDIEDIALGLTRQNRFLGQTRVAINVAWHSINLSHVVPKELKLAALVHDITEAYLMDIPRPLKNHPAFSFFKQAEDKLFTQMCEAMNLPFRVLPDDLHQWDADIGMAEMFIYNPTGYERVLSMGFPLERHQAAQKLAKRVKDLQERETVPKPGRESAIKMAWLERLRKLHKK